MKETLSNTGLPAERIFVQHNLHDFEKFAAVEGVEPEYDLIYVGNFQKVKRLDILIEAMACIRQKRPETTLLMIGDGPERRPLQERCRELGLQDNVHFQRELPFDELPGWYTRAKVLVMTSQNEGLPMSMVEAMSCGLPVIVPSVGDIEEVAVNGVNAIVVPPLDVEEVTRAVIRILTDSHLYYSLRAGALDLRKTHGADFSIENQKILWEETIRKIVHQGMWSPCPPDAGEERNEKNRG
jgi:glycosyltransferase involved in cell wall biosynthesis